MTSGKKMFLVLWSMGMAGILSFLLVDVSALIASLPPPPGPPVELPPPLLLKLLTIIQPTVLMTLAVLVGMWLAPKVGLRAPAAEAAAGGTSFLAALRPQLMPGVVAGLASGVAIVLSWVIAKPFLSADFVTRAETFNAFIPAPVRFLYGGLTEELLLRWGMMTFLVWVQWRLFQRGEGQPKLFYFIAAIVFSALLFGLGHLPVASLLAGGLTLPLVIYVVTGNSIFGIAAGYLYWRRGLEAAMIAHISAHIVLIAAIYLAF